jgi:hypothetical protein
MEILVLKKTVCAVVMLSLLPLAACTEDETTDEPTLGETTSHVFAQGVAPGSARFMVKRGSMCLAAPIAGNGPVVQLPCASDQRFWWVAEPDKVADRSGNARIFKIHNQGRCLDIPDFGPGSLIQNGANLQAYSCAQPMESATQLNQQFKFNRIAAGEYQIQPMIGVTANANLCLDIEWGTTTPGNALQQFTCKTSDVENQRFLLRPRLYQHKYLDCDDSDPLNVTATLLAGDTVRDNTIVNFPAGPFRTITMNCDGDIENRICNGATAQIDRLNSASDEYTFTCWE